MSNTSPSFGALPVPRRSEVLTLGSNPIVSVDPDRRLINFEETRFRVHAQRFQKSLRPLALEVAKELGIGLSTLELLKNEARDDLQSKTYCTFDFLDVQTRRIRGFPKTKWMPLVIFSGGERILSLHSSYGDDGSKLTGITLHLDGRDEYTKCTTIRSALKVSLSYIRTYASRNS